MNRMRWGLVALLVLSFPGLAAAAAVFDKQYVRAVAAPLSVTDQFASCDPRGSFQLVVVNGPGGRGRVSSASISVNGVEVVHERDFNQQVDRLVRALANVGEKNSLTVVLASGPAAAIQVTVEADERCQGITITSPLAGAFVQSPLLVRGEARAPAGADVGVTVNGRPAFVSGVSFAALVPLEAGAQTITASLNGATGSPRRTRSPWTSRQRRRRSVSSLLPGQVSPR